MNINNNGVADSDTTIPSIENLNTGKGMNPTASQGINNKRNNNTKINPKLDLSNLDKHIDSISTVNIEFPVDALPAPVKEIIFQTNSCLNFPIPFIASSLLHAAGTAIGNTYRAKYKWDEGANLFMVLVGNPGTIKSHTPEFAYAPLSENDSESYRTYKEKLRIYECAAATYSKRDGGDPPLKPLLKKHIVSDCTIEALVNVLSDNPRGICSYTDELAGWINNMNRYNNGSDLQQWLTLWSGKPLIVDRKTSGAIRIDKPFISVIGTIQPSVIDEMAKDNKNKNGFTDRILFIKPKNLKRQKWTNKELDNSISGTWFSIIKNLLSLNFAIGPNEQKEIPHYLRFTKEAETFLMDWQALNIKNDEKYGSETRDGISAKIEIYVIRFSLIMQLLKWACDEADNTAINEESVKSAIAIAEYFKGQALDVAEYINNRNPVERLPELKQNIYRALKETFSTAEGVIIAEEVGMPKRTFEYWIKEKTFFTRIKQGEYKKNYV